MLLARSVSIVYLGICKYDISFLDFVLIMMINFCFLHFQERGHLTRKMKVSYTHSYKYQVNKSCLVNEWNFIEFLI